MLLAGITIQSEVVKQHPLDFGIEVSMRGRRWIGVGVVSFNE
jgi:hypothetical protein